MEPTRLLDEGATEFERWLLDTAHSERPTAELDERMLSALSALPASAVPASAPTHGVPADGQAAASGTGAQAPSAWGLGKLSLGKWGAGIGIASIALTAFLLHQSGPETAAHAAALSPSVTVHSAKLPRADLAEAGLAEASQSSEAVPTAGSEVVVAAPVEADAVNDAPNAARPMARAAYKESSPSDPLKDELALLERVRGALTQHRPSVALGLLSQYGRRYPHGQLSQEATVLRVQALEARGKDAQADRVAQDFLHKNPTSAHAPQIERSRSTP